VNVFGPPGVPGAGGRPCEAVDALDVAAGPAVLPEAVAVDDEEPVAAEEEAPVATEEAAPVSVADEAAVDVAEAEIASDDEAVLVAAAMIIEEASSGEMVRVVTDSRAGAPSPPRAS